MTETIVSRARDWRGGSPPDTLRLTCARCGQETRIGQWDAPPCIAHLEFANSGFLGESK